GRRAVGAVASGWRMFVYALVFAFVSLLVLAAINPSATSTVVRGETDRNGGYGFTMVNHVLALPNQSMLVLVPAMGGCDGAYGSGGPASVRFDALCYSHFPRGDRTTPIPGGTPFFGASTTQIGGTPALPFGFGSAPARSFLFLLVPAAAVLLGGWGAARRRSAATRAEAALAGGPAG